VTPDTRIDLNTIDPDAAQLIVGLLAHTYFMHGYLIGLALRDGAKSTAEVWADLKPIADVTRQLAAIAGVPVPPYLDPDPDPDPAPEPKDESK
jgi:hypothetical protein